MRRSSSRIGARRQGEAGFTLLETIIAFTILSISLAVLLPAFADGLKSLDRADVLTAAVAVATSKLEQVGRAIPLEEGEVRGVTENGLNWVVAIRPSWAERDASGFEIGPPLVPYDVAVTVENRGLSVTLNSLRLGEEQ